MPTIHTLALFSAAALVLLLVPGPAVLYIVNRSIAQGARAGLVSVAGIHVGTLVHVAAGILGLSAILMTSAAAFGAVKVAGAVYLVWLGIRAWTGAGRETPTTVSSRPLRRVFVDGVVVNTLNPKTAAFFLAFVPQFVDHTRPDTTSQLLILGGLFIALGIISDGAYALAAGSIGGWFARNPTYTTVRDRASGAVLVGLGAAALFARVE